MNKYIYIDLKKEEYMDKKSKVRCDEDGISYVSDKEQKEIEKLHPDLFDGTFGKEYNSKDYIRL